MKPDLFSTLLGCMTLHDEYDIFTNTGQSELTEIAKSFGFTNGEILKNFSSLDLDAQRSALAVLRQIEKQYSRKSLEHLLKDPSSSQDGFVQALAHLMVSLDQRRSMEKQQKANQASSDQNAAIAARSLTRHQNQRRVCGQSKPVRSLRQADHGQ